jgi:uncharacterized protein (DUF58 family)
MLPDVFTSSYLRQLEMLSINTRRAFLGQRQGTHISLKRGQGIEFFDYRKYELGDNPRHIDWGLFGRSEKLYVKRFREEQALSILMLMDTSPSMAVMPAKGISKWEMARNLALSLSYIALMKHDTVFVGLTSGGAIPRYGGGQGIHRMSDFFTGVQPAQPANLVREVMRVASRVKFPGMVLFFSDLLFPFEDFQQSVNILLSKNLDMSVIRVASPLEHDPFQGVQSALAVDSETGEEIEMALSSGALDEYRRRLAEHIDRNRKFLAHRGIRLLEVTTEVPLVSVVAQDLVRAGVVQ